MLQMNILFQDTFIGSAPAIISLILSSLSLPSSLLDEYEPLWVWPCMIALVLSCLFIFPPSSLLGFPPFLSINSNTPSPFIHFHPFFSWADKSSWPQRALSDVWKCLNELQIARVRVTGQGRACPVGLLEDVMLQTPSLRPFSSPSVSPQQPPASSGSPPGTGHGAAAWKCWALARRQRMGAWGWPRRPGLMPACSAQLPPRLWWRTSQGPPHLWCCGHV